MKIISIKNKKKIEIVYATENNAGGYDDRVIKSEEHPRPEFYEAMNALREDAHRLMEYTDSKLGRLYLTGIKFSHSAKGAIGISMEGAILLETTAVYSDFTTYEVYTSHPGKDVQPEQVLVEQHQMVEFYSG